MHVYQRIRDLREDVDKTQAQIAENLNMYLTTYRRYECGDRVPPFSFIIELAKLYDVSIDYIAGLTNDKGGLHKNNKSEQSLIDSFNRLSDTNKGKITERIDILLEQQKNIK